MCPGAPLLIPGLADGLRTQLPELVDACDRAVRTLGAVDRLLLLCSGPRARDAGPSGHPASVVHRPGTTVSSAPITGTGPVHFTGRLGGAPAGRSRVGPPAGVGVIVGAALLAGAAIDLPLTAVDLAERTPEVAALLDEARTSADRVGLLVVAEGTANRGPESPGGGCGDAEVLDTALAAALADGDPDALREAAGIEESTAARLLFTSGPALLAMADLTACRPPQRAEVLLDQAPLGVAYLVAAWSWAG